MGMNFIQYRYFRQACQDKKIEQARELLPDIDVNYQDDFGFTVLMDIVSDNNLEATLFLIENGASINLQDEKGNTALINACCSGSIEIVELLLDAGADVTLKDENGITALRNAQNQLEWATKDDAKEVYEKIIILLESNHATKVEKQLGEIEWEEVYVI